MIHCHHLELKTKLKRTSAEIKEENLNNKVARTAQQSEFSAEDWWESAARRRVLIWFLHGQIQQRFRLDSRGLDWSLLLKLLNCCLHLSRLQLCLNVLVTWVWAQSNLNSPWKFEMARVSIKTSVLLIEAPIIGCPVESDTFPVTVWFSHVHFVQSWSKWTQIIGKKN